MAEDLAPAHGVSDRLRRRARLLVVDDDPGVRRVAAEMLRASGYTVEVACGSNETLASA